jgi:tubulin polyglutamylase TTLL2
MEYQYKLIYKIEKSIPAVVQKILEEMGFIEWDATIHHEDQWNILWKSVRPSLGEFRRAKTYQKLIHIPKTGLICTKDNLARLIKKAK